MDSRINSSNKYSLALFLALFIPLLSLNARAIGDYEQVKVYSPAGKLLGEINSPDDDGYYSAKRYLYSEVMPTVITEIQYGSLSTAPDIDQDPKDWSGFEQSYSEVFLQDEYGRNAWHIKDGEGDEIGYKQYSYDERGRLECETVRMNQVANMNNHACNLGIEGADGPDRITRYSYDDIDNLLKIEKAVGTPLEQVYAKYTYEGRMKTSVMDANFNYSKYTYDDQHRLEYFYYPNKTLRAHHSTTDYEKYGYDNNGNRISWRRRNGRMFYYEFDALNRMEIKNVPSTTSKDVYYKYELNGAMTEALFSSHNGRGVKHELNGFGDILSTVPNNYGSRELRYVYDEHSNREYVYYPDNAYVRYFYDKVDRPYRIQISGSTFAWYDYDNFGRLESMDRNYSRNGAPTSINYDDFGRITGIAHDFDYTASDFNNSFSYNPASQINSIHYANDQYKYIANNQLKGAYAVNGLNQYTSIAGKSMDYDTKGNLYKYDGATYTYDDENCLTKVARSGQSTFYLYYDPFGRLERTIHGGSSTYFLWDGDALVAEYLSTSSNAPLMRYVHGIGMDVPLLQIEGSSTSTSQRRAIHADQRGSVVAYSDYYGNETNINSYDEFGVPGFENLGRFGYTGQIWLPEIGLYHYKARMYEPRLGRFLQTDPVGYEDQMNLYAYVHNDPMNLVDPDGEFAVLVGAIVGAGLDFVAQSVMIASGVQTGGYDLKSIGVSAASGALGAGLAANVAKLGMGVKASLAANVGSDVVVSSASTALKGGDVTLTSVAIDVVAGQSAGKATGDLATKAASNTASQKVANRVADRASRIANRSNSRRAQRTRAYQAQAAARELPAEAGAAGGTVGSGALSNGANTACNIADGENNGC